VEVSFLPAAGQRWLLRAASRRSHLAAELRELNAGPLEAMERLLGVGRGLREAGQHGYSELAEQIEMRFGPRRFAEAFAGICRSFDSEPAAGASAASAPDVGAIWDRVIRRFATVENVRLLHGD
jgi:hypothetical protein